MFGNAFHANANILIKSGNRNKNLRQN